MLVDSSFGMKIRAMRREMLDLFTFIEDKHLDGKCFEDVHPDLAERLWSYADQGESWGFNAVMTQIRQKYGAK